MKARVANPGDKPINRFVAALEGHRCDPKPKGKGQWEAKCPAHEDHDPSLGFTEGDDGRVLAKCRAGCAFPDVMKSLGLDESDAFVPNEPAVRKPKRKSRDRNRDKAGVLYKTPEAAIEACARGRGTVSTKLGPWIYNDLESFEVMRVYRIDEPGGKKGFRPIYPDEKGWRPGDPCNTGLPLYHLDKLQAAEVVYVAEGEKCADLVGGLGFVATTSSHGSGSPEKTDWAPLGGKKVVLIPDHDKPGEKYVSVVGEILSRLEPKPSVKVLRLPLANEGDDVEQWLESLPELWETPQIRAELEKLAAVAPEWAGPEAPPLVVRADAVEEQDIGWLWQGRIPYGFITIFAGRTGVGKSFVALDIAARKTRGDSWPDGDGEHCSVGNVLVISEDPHSTVLKPRLRAMKADLSRVFFMTWEAMAAYELADTDMLDEIVRQAGNPDLIIIDPPTNFLGEVDEHRNSEVRGVLMKLVAWLVKQSRPIALDPDHPGYQGRQGSRGSQPDHRQCGVVRNITNRTYVCPQQGNRGRRLLLLPQVQPRSAPENAGLSHRSRGKASPHRVGRRIREVG